MSNRTNKILKQLLAGNSRFAFGLDRSMDYRDPNGVRVFILACSDLKYAPEQVFDLAPSEAWVYQVAANIASDDAREQILYAQTQGDLDLVVVLGHSRCLTIERAFGDRNRPTLIASEILESMGTALAEQASDVTSVHVDRMARTMHEKLTECVGIGVVAAHLDDLTGLVTLHSIGQATEE